MPTPPFLLVAADVIKTGGMDRANYALADYVARRGDPVEIVSHRVGEGLLRYPNLRWRRVPRPLGHDMLGWGPINRAGRRAARRVDAAGGRVLVNGANCDWGDLNWVHYVHAAWRPPSTVARGALERYTVWQCRREERRILPRARWLIANSELTRKQLIAELGARPERVVTVHYGCDPELFAPAAPAERQALRQKLGWDQNQRVAIFIGALGDDRKGFDTLFRAWQQLAAVGGATPRLLVVGSGRASGRWQARVAEAGMGDAVQFLGFRRDVPDLLRAADLIVAPSRYEAFGLAVQEAVACGLPAVVSANSGVVERLPAEWAPLLLHDPNSADELAARLRTWQASPVRFREIALAAAAMLRRYTWDDMAEELLRRTAPPANP